MKIMLERFYPSSRVIILMREKVQFAKDIVLQGKYFFEDPTEYDDSVIQKKWRENTNEILADIANKFQSLSESASPDEYENAFKEVCQNHGEKPGSLLQPLRVVVSGQGVGAPIWDMIALIGRDYIINRIQMAIDKISFSIG